MARSRRLLAACAAPLALSAISVLGALSALAAPPAGTLTLTFVRPEAYTDAA